MVAIFSFYARLSLIMLQIIKSLGVVIVAVVFFAACGEALVSQVGGEFDKATGGCEHCEHCESDTKLVDTEDGSKAADKEVASKDTNEENALRGSDVKVNSNETDKEDDLKKSSQEDKVAN